MYGRLAGGRVGESAGGLAAIFSTQRRRRRSLPFIRGIDDWLAHQLPGKPEGGAGPSQPLGLGSFTKAKVSL